MGAALILAEVHTAHFDFAALGRTKEEANQALREGWEVHCRDYPDADMGYINVLIDEEDVNYSTMTIGGCTRDGETLT